MTGQQSHSDDGVNLAQNQPDSPGDDLILINIAVQIVRRKKMIAIFTIICTLIGVVLCFILPLRYISTAVLMPPQQMPSASALLMANQLAGGAGSLAAMGAGSVLGLKNPSDLYIGLMKSRPVADAIINKFDLMHAYRQKNMTDCRKVLEDNTDISAEKSGLISIAVTDKDKYRSAEIANMYTEQLRALTQTLAVTEASRRALFYENQLKDAGDALANAEHAFQQMEQTKGIVQPDAQTKAMIEGLTELRAKVAAQEVTVQALKSFATENNPQLEIAEKQLESMRGQVASVEQRSHSNGFSEMGLEDIPAAGMDYLRAQRNVVYRQTLFDVLLKQYEAAKLDESKDATTIQVVEPGIVPDKHSSPHRSIVLVASILIGFFLGCIVAIFMWWKENMMSNQEVSTRFLELKNAISDWK